MDQTNENQRRQESLQDNFLQQRKINLSRRKKLPCKTLESRETLVQQVRVHVRTNNLLKNSIPSPLEGKWKVGLWGHWTVPGLRSQEAGEVFTPPGCPAAALTPESSVVLAWIWHRVSHGKWETCYHCLSLLEHQLMETSKAFVLSATESTGATVGVQ